MCIFLLRRLHSCKICYAVWKLVCHTIMNIFSIGRVPMSQLQFIHCWAFKTRLISGNGYLIQQLQRAQCLYMLVKKVSLTIRRVYFGVLIAVVKELIKGGFQEVAVRSIYISFERTLFSKNRCHKQHTILMKF